MNKIESGRYYTDRQLADVYNVGRSSIWSWVAKGLLPKPRKLGLRTSRWFGDDLLKLEKERSDA